MTAELVEGEEMTEKGVEADLLSVYYTNLSDFTGVSLINCKLNGSNYLTWSKAMLTALTVKNKVRLIDGKVPRPPKGNPNRARCDMCNALLLKYCGRISMKDTRRVTGNETRIYQLKADIGKLRQEGLVIMKYHSRLITLLEGICEAVKTYATQREREKIH
ncbi:hypothetical protein CRG98_032653 [Punica granatum]|uniref:Retrotransposon Copia-like N-terminal domain-containing protein n=1 Tax=Punica granatum TaxID=22663 RepID=A0A2I0ISJ2_PUNGR|nr:hypothetical protein CRG98_032653 [Punica granatum]